MSWTSGIPAAQNNPTNDQPLMLNNFRAINTWSLVDHVGVAQGGSTFGMHTQLHLPVFSSSTTVTSGSGNQGSVLFTSAGVADATNPQISFKNTNGTFPLGAIKAYGVFDTNGATVSSQALNLSSSGWGAGTGYVMAFGAKIVSGPSYGVIETPRVNALNPGVTVMYTISSATAFNIGFRNISGTFIQVDGFTCIVYQL